MQKLLQKQQNYSKKFLRFPEKRFVEAVGICAAVVETHWVMYCVMRSS